MHDEEPPKFRKDGELDGRGQAAGSRTTQFARGDGRRRPGRRKGARDLKSIVSDVRNLPVDLSSKRGRRTVNTQEALLLAQRSKALAGDTRAADFLQKRFEQFDVPQVDHEGIKQLLLEDADILKAAAARGLLGEIKEGEEQ